MCGKTLMLVRLIWRMIISIKLHTFAPVLMTLTHLQGYSIVETVKTKVALKIKSKKMGERVLIHHGLT